MQSDRPEVLDLVDAIHSVADAVTPRNAMGATTEDGHVESLTEAVMDVAAVLRRIASGIEDLAQAVRESPDRR